MAFTVKWDETGERTYESGVDLGVLKHNIKGAYPKGSGWNGLISVTKKPSGAEFTPLYANNKKYANLQSAEDFACTIEAYTYPKEFAACNGRVEIAPGVTIGQQPRIPFGMTYRNYIGNDSEGVKAAYKITLVYGAQAAPSEETDTTINDDPDAKTMSWECETTPVEVEGYEPTATFEIDSRTTDPTNLAALEAILYGDGETEARLPLPEEVVSLIGTASAED